MTASGARMELRLDLLSLRLCPGGMQMKKIARNVGAVLLGLLLGGLVNMALVIVGPVLIPPPDGVDMTNTEALSQSIHLLEPKHFIFPFLAHALGTLTGALTAYLIALSYRRVLSYTIAAFFLLGGIAASSMIPAPTWFVALDLLMAYLPMAFLAILMGEHLFSRLNSGLVNSQ